MKATCTSWPPTRTMCGGVRRIWRAGARLHLNVSGTRRRIILSSFDPWVCCRTAHRPIFRLRAGGLGAMMRRQRIREMIGVRGVTCLASLIAAVCLTGCGASLSDNPSGALTVADNSPASGLGTPSSSTPAGCHCGHPKLRPGIAHGDSRPPSPPALAQRRRSPRR